MTNSGLTIDDLPDEVLDKILSYLNWKGQLRCSLVAKKWFHIVNNNPKIMRRVAFIVDTLNATSPFLTGQLTHLTRTYRNIVITRLRRLSSLPDKAIEALTEALAIAEWVKFKTCSFPMLQDFQRLVTMCVSAKIIEFDNIRVAVDQDQKHLVASKVDSIKIVLSYQTSFEVLACFANIAELDLQFRLSKLHFSELLSRYGSVIKSLRVPQNSDAIQQLVRTENLRLNRAAIYGIVDNLTNLRDLFKHQASCLTDLSVSAIGAEVFDQICGLHNLTRLSFERKEEFRLTGLKALQKLKILDLGDTVEASEELVISLSPTVTDFHFRSYTQSAIYSFTSPEGVLGGVTRMWLSFANGTSCRMDRVAALFPNLEHLSVETTKSFTHFDINDLKYLKTVSLDYMLVSEDFLQRLRSPELRDMGIVKYQHGTESITDTTLERLTANCPHLVRIFSEKWRGLRREPKLQLKRMLARRKTGALRHTCPRTDEYRYDADSNDEDDF